MSGQEDINDITKQRLVYRPDMALGGQFERVAKSDYYKFRRGNRKQMKGLSDLRQRVIDKLIDALTNPDFGFIPPYNRDIGYLKRDLRVGEPTEALKYETRRDRDGSVLRESAACLELFSGLALGTILKVEGKNPDRAPLVVDVLEKRHDAGLPPIKPEAMLDPDCMWFRSFRLVASIASWRGERFLHFNLFRLGEPRAVLAHLLEKNSFLLDDVAYDDMAHLIRKIYKKRESMNYGVEGLRSCGFPKQPVQMAEDSSKSAIEEKGLIGDLRLMTVKAIEENHPRAKKLKKKLQQIDNLLGEEQFKPITNKKERLREEFEKQMAELNEQESLSRTLFGMKKPVLPKGTSSKNGPS